MKDPLNEWNFDISYLKYKNDVQAKFLKVN